MGIVQLNVWALALETPKDAAATKSPASRAGEEKCPKPPPIQLIVTGFRNTRSCRPPRSFLGSTGGQSIGTYHTYRNCTICLEEGAKSFPHLLTGDGAHGGQRPNRRTAT